MRQSARVFQLKIKFQLPLQGDAPCDLEENIQLKMYGFPLSRLIKSVNTEEEANFSCNKSRSVTLRIVKKP